MEMSPLTTQSANERTVVFPVYVVPRAAKNEIVGMEGETLKVRVTAPPVKGRANEALLKLLAKTLGLTKYQVEIIAGHRARHKMVRAEGIDENALLDLLLRRRDKR